jgi:hypothetical protein
MSRFSEGNDYGRRPGYDEWRGTQDTSINMRALWAIVIVIYVASCAHSSPSHMPDDEQFNTFELASPDIGTYRFPATSEESGDRLTIVSQRKALQRLLGFWRSLYLALSSDYRFSGEVLRATIPLDPGDRGAQATARATIFPFGQFSSVKQCAASSSRCMEIYNEQDLVARVRPLE